jgi:hypothetical protein
MTPERIAAEFAGMLLEDLGADTLAEIIARNVNYGPSVCASHDFCDANMVMLAAFESLVVASPLDLDDGTPEREEADRLWGAAWDVAKASSFASALSAARGD